MVAKRAPRVEAYFICLPILSASGYTSTRSPPARNTLASARVSPTRRHSRQSPARRRRRRGLGRKHPALGHHDEDALETQREAAGRHRLARTSPPGCRIAPRRRGSRRSDRDFEDRAGVVRQASGQRRVHAQWRPADVASDSCRIVRSVFRPSVALTWLATCSDRRASNASLDAAAGIVKAWSTWRAASASTPRATNSSITPVAPILSSLSIATSAGRAVSGTPAASSRPARPRGDSAGW